MVVEPLEMLMYPLGMIQMAMENRKTMGKPEENDREMDIYPLVMTNR